MAPRGEFKDTIDILSSAPFEKYSGKRLVKKGKRLKASCSRTIKSMKKYLRERRDMRKIHREQLEIDNKRCNEFL